MDDWKERTGDIHARQVPGWKSSPPGQGWQVRSRPNEPGILAVVGPLAGEACVEVTASAGRALKSFFCTWYCILAVHLRRTKIQLLEVQYDCFFIGVGAGDS